MKHIGRILIALVCLAVAGFLALAAFQPEKALELQNRLNQASLHRGEALEVTPVRTLETAYGFTVEEIINAGCDSGSDSTVYTWFRDLDRDLWLPLYTDLMTRHTIGKAAVCDREGVVKWLEEGVVTGSTDAGEVCFPAGVFADLPEGDYYLAYQMLPEEGASEPPWYRTVYVAVRDRCDFHTEDYRLAPSGDVLFDRSAGEGFTFHLANLGDNIITDVWYLQLVNTMDPYYIPKHLTEGQDYVLSGDGASVTLTPEYLSSLTLLCQYHFRFGLGDQSTVSTSGDAGKDELMALILTDGPLANPPYVDGPRTWSLSSGEDYPLALEMGRALAIWEDGSILHFYGPEGQPLLDEHGEEKNWFTFRNDSLPADGVYPIPASVFQEAAAQGGSGSVYLGISLQISNYGYAGYYAWYGYSIELTP